MDLLAATKAFIDEPFKQPVDLGQLFLIVGLVMVMSALWSRILAHLAH